MRDYYEHNIDVGDDVILAHEQAAIDGMLSVLKKYRVEGLREEEGRIVITDDRGLEGWYRSDRFQTLQHFSELP